VNKLQQFPFKWVMLVAAATLGMFFLLGWHVWNTFRMSHLLKVEYSQGLSTASRILSTHQRLVHEAHLIVIDGKPEKVDVYQKIEGQLRQFFEDAHREQGGDRLFSALLDSMENVNKALRQLEREALAALSQGDALAASDLLHRQSNRNLAGTLEVEVVAYIAALDRVFRERLDAEEKKELGSLLVAFGIFGLSAGIWVLLIRRLRTWGRALENEMAQRRKAEDQLRRAQKMEALGQLAAGVSHDFNNILTVIQGFADVARNRSNNWSSAMESLEKIESAARQGTDLTRSLLTFSGRAGTQMGPVDLGKLVTQTVHMLDETIPASVLTRVDSAVPEEGGWVWGNRTQLQQVLVNLVLNARDAMPAGGGSLVIIMERKPGVAEWAELGVLRLSVTDTGAGMTEEIRERIFEPFFTTKTRGRGTGLGLAVVASIVNEHSGRIKVDSTPGQGTTVTLDFPAIGPPDAAKRWVDGASVRVLVASADPFVGDLLVSALAGAGYSVTEGGSDLALKRAVGSDAWDLILIDSERQECSNQEVIELLASRTEDTRVVAIGQTVPDIFEQRLGPDVLILNKPFMIDELMRLISSLTSSHAATQGSDSGRR
jgi:signal transduction histidine kinase